MVEVNDLTIINEKTCGTCNWFVPYTWINTLPDKGHCDYPIPPLPYSIPYQSRIEKESVYDYFKDCPTWEEK